MTTVVEELRRGPESELPPVAARRHPWRTGFAVFLLVAAAWSAYLLSRNERFGWDVIGTYLFSEPVLDGLVLTLWLTVVSMAIGILLGIVLAVMRSSENFVISGLAAGYVWFFRGVPLLVLLVFWYNLAALFPTIGVGVPGVFSVVDLNTNALITPVAAAIIGLGLNEAAFMSEIVRAGMRSVDRGQIEAARALGMSPDLVLRRIVLPQAMRLIIPPTANEIVNMLKTTSLVSVLAVADLMYSVQQIYASNFQTIPLLIVASVWYLVLTSVLSVGQYFLEKRYSKGVQVRKSRLALRRAEGGS
ncbi:MULTISPECIES: amino acid ABC transporter permease [Streptomyces]|uniref:Amino acid ABC transporter permease n=1 Tax=Streptomyces cadmiisoli TaxID=2184053 RepID=A0A2Z4JDS5_9ACTN|nr:MULTISPECIES: amino acid ABC transporter permease [Streptomyces]AWW43070.1 amino acid ABC transporter permease [Streptomyces cadmiisoli]